LLFLGNVAEGVGAIELFDEGGRIVNFLNAKFEGGDVGSVEVNADFLAGQKSFVGGNGKVGAGALASDGHEDGEEEKAGEE
jgi:type V secretory pathway adhesin AidA